MSMDYLDKGPQRYLIGAGRDQDGKPILVTAPDPGGEWVRFEDMDLYMFEGGQLMRQCLLERNQANAEIDQLSDEVAAARECLRESRVEIERFRSESEDLLAQVRYLMRDQSVKCSEIEQLEGELQVAVSARDHANDMFFKARDELAHKDAYYSQFDLTPKLFPQTGDKP